MRDRSDLRWDGRALHLGEQTDPLLTVVPDSRWPGMYRVRHRDGQLSDIVNLHRARDAALSIALAEVNPKGGILRAEAPPMRSRRGSLSDIGRNLGINDGGGA